MLVIEGYTGKSLAVEKYLKSLDCDKVLIVEKSSFKIGFLNLEEIKPKVFSIYWEHLDKSEDMDDLIKCFKEIMELNKEEPFKHVVFYLNVSREDIPKFKALESEYYDLNIVLTVQKNVEEYYV